MTCWFPWAPEVWLCGWEQGLLPHQALVGLQSCTVCSSRGAPSPVASLPVGGLVTQGFLLISIWLHPRVGLPGWV